MKVRSDRLIWRCRILTVVLLHCFLSSAMAVTNYVSLTGAGIFPYGSWADAATNIQAAIDATVDGDTVLVSNGVYNAGSTTPVSNIACRIVITNAITVQSVNGPDYTIIEGKGPIGNSAIRCAYVGSNATLTGFTLTNGFTRFSGSELQVSGGGVMCDGGGTVVNCRITYNSGMKGGGAFLNYGGTLRNCLVVHNEGGTLAGGVLLYYGGLLENCTVSTNYSNNDGGGIYCLEGGSVRNSIIFHNDSFVPSGRNYVNFGSNMVYEFNCTTPSIAGTNNITSDPAFTNIVAEDYRLSLGSPCIDTGTNTGWMAGATDFGGNSRIMNGTVDMGCSEYLYYSIIASSGANGLIVPVGTRIVARGTDTNFTMYPSLNYHVLDVQVDGSSVGASNTYTFANVTSNHTINVAFTIDRFDLVVTNAHGAAVPSGTTTYDYGTSVDCSVTNSPFLDVTTQYVCTGWAGSGSVPATGVQTNVTVILTNTSSLTWLWQTNFWLDVTAGADGTVDVASAWCMADTNVTLTATPSNGYHFVDWTGDIASTNNPLIVSMTQPYAVVANFAINMYDIIATAGLNGAISPSGTVQVAYDGGTNFVITPDLNYHVLDVLVDSASVGPSNSYVFANVTNAHTVEAFFAIDTYTLTVATPYGTASPGGITTNGYGTNLFCSVVDSPVDVGTTQYACIGWTGTGSVPASGIGTNVSVTISNDSAMTWLWMTNYWLNSVAGPDGAVDVGPQWLAKDSTIMITATQAARSFFAGWTGDVPPANTNDNPLTLTMDQARSVVANFIITTHYVSPAGSNISPYTTWETAATNIQDAVDVCEDGARVLVSNGVYTLTQPIVMTNGMRIQSLNGPDFTILDGNNTTQCLYSCNVSNIVDGFTLMRGVGVNGGGGDFSGGGTIRNCVVYTNSAQWGGGLYLGSNATVVSCIIKDNYAAQSGGGVCVGDTGTVQNCTVFRNGAAVSGGGLYSSVELTLRDSIIHSNSAPAGTNYSVSGTLNSSYNSATPLLAGAGCIISDPLLTPLGRLRSASPCIDAGVTNGAPSSDIDGELRWDDPGRVNVISTVDIGADEFTDVDLDSMADTWEIGQFGSATNSNGTADSDGEGLADLQEYDNSLCPTNATTYGDSLNDLWKSIYGYTVPHRIGDLNLAVDSDQDGLADSWEMAQWGNLGQLGTGDFDTDSISNWGEYLIGSDPQNADTDGDNLTDSAEIGTYFTDPRLADTDGDTWQDGDEIAQGTDPRVAASFPASISGTISYSGIQTGTAWIVVTNSALSTNVAIAVPGAYSVTNRHTMTNHWINAFRDMNGNGVWDSWEAAGSYSNNPVSLSNDTAGIDIDLVDPQYNFVVDGNPLQLGAPLPYGYGTNLLTASEVVTNSVALRVVNGATQFICTGWTGTGSVPPSGGTTNVNVTITNASTLTWNWSPEYYYFTVSAGPNGSAGGTSGWYAAGSSITNVVVPSNGYHFAGWTGDVPAGNTNDTTLVLAVDQARVITANFDINTYTITPSVGPNGVIVPSSPVQVAHGGNSTFTITPSANYHVADVSVDGGSVGVTNGWTFNNVTNSHTIHADFAIDMYNITASSDVNGSIVPSGVIALPYGGGTNFVMTPNATYYVKDVLVDSVSVGAVTGYVFSSISTAHTIAVSFDDKYALNVASAHGTASPAGPNMFKYGTNVYCAVLDSPVLNGSETQYVCSGWTGTGSVPSTGAGTNVTVTVTNDSTLSWVWGTNYWLHAVTGSTNGSIDTGDGWYADGATVTITAVASNHYTFAGWSGTVSTTNNPLALTMSQAHSVTANFAIVTYGITATAGAFGSIVPAGTVQVPYDGTTNFSIVPLANYHISNVVVDAVSVGVTNSYTFANVTNAHTIDATFAVNQYDLTVTSAFGTPNPSGVSTYDWLTPLSCSVGGSPIINGMTQQVCIGWSGTGSPPASGAGTNVSFSLGTNSTVNWNWQTYYQMNAVAGPFGTVTATNGWLQAGTITVLYANPITNYHFTGWTGDIVSTNNPQAALMDRGYSVVANFAIDTFNITATAGANGSITPSGAVSVVYGQGTNFVITPNAYYYISDVVVDGVSIGVTNAYAFTNVTTAHTISAIFGITSVNLAVNSLFGSPLPGLGANVLNWGTVTNCTVAGSPVVNGTTQYVCTGWTGSGSIPASGTGTNISVTLTNNSTLTWVWKTNYWLTTGAMTNGTIDVSSGWFRAGTNLTITATPLPGYWFAGWTGDVAVADLNKNPLPVTMSAPKVIGATFALSPYYVSPTGRHIWPFTSWANAATNIQAAVDVAGNGRMVLVTNGTYVVALPVKVTKGILMQSVNGAGSTIISGNNLAQCLSISHSNAVVTGFTITHGYTAADGGGVKITGGTLQNCTVSVNVAGRYGGGIYCLTNGVVASCTVSGNKSMYGGGVQCEDGGLVGGCTMNGNEAYFGGGVRLKNGGTMTNCTLNNNTAYTSGGGVQTVDTGNVFNCTMLANVCSNYGGGIYLYQGGYATNCIMSNNKAVYGGGAHCEGGGVVEWSVMNGNSATYGGGFRSRQGGTARYCVINNNTAYAGGGAEHVTAGSLINCSLSGNLATNGGGGVYCYLGGTVESCVISGNTAGRAGGVLAESGGAIVNTIIQFNGAGMGTNYLNSGAGVTYSYCCTTPAVTGEGNITADPKFLDSAASDYHLLPGSPCINAGTNRAWMTGAVDMDGEPRLTCWTVDMGVYETVDVDADGLSDWDEANVYGTNPLVADTDGDGMRDGSEVIAGTNPLLAGDELKVTDAGRPAANRFVISWQSYTGRLYTIMSTRDLISSPWTNIPAFMNVPGNGGVMSWTNTLMSAPVDFYRVGVRLP